MSGSGKGLLGLWLYRNGSEWQVKNEAAHHPKLGELQMAARQQSASQTSESERISVILTLKNQVGGLVRVLSVFQDLGINVLHIESRKSITANTSVSLIDDINCSSCLSWLLSTVMTSVAQWTSPRGGGGTNVFMFCKYSFRVRGISA